MVYQLIWKWLKALPTKQSILSEEYRKVNSTWLIENGKQKRNTTRTIKNLEIEGRMFKCLTVNEAKRDKKKIKALGPDRIAPIHLNHLGLIALGYLTDTIHCSLNSTKIQNMWEVGQVIPLHKPGKPIDESKSFRLIELFSLIAKLTEKHLLSDFIEDLLKEHQQGFRS